MAIHEQQYVRYDGPLNEGRGWMTFARTTLALAWSFTRTKLLIFLLWIPVLTMLVLVMLEPGLRDLPEQIAGGESAPGAAGASFYLQVQFFSAALLMLASGCGVVADDLRYQTFQLYFSRPVERRDYILGKFLGLFLLCSTVTLLPTLIVGGVRMAYFAGTDLASAIASQTLTAMGLSVVLTLVVTSVILGLSSTTRRTGYAVLSWIGVLFVPMIVTAIVLIASSGSDAAHLWNLSGNLLLLNQHLLGDSPPEVALVWPVFILGGVCAAGLFAARYRVEKLEGIA